VISFTIRFRKARETSGKGTGDGLGKLVSAFALYEVPRAE
jgi:hypothetical protein